MYKHLKNKKTLKELPNLYFGSELNLIVHSSLDSELHARTDSPTVGSKRTFCPQTDCLVLPLVGSETQQWSPLSQDQVPINETLPTRNWLPPWCWLSWAALTAILGPSSRTLGWSLGMFSRTFPAQTWSYLILAPLTWISPKTIFYGVALIGGDLEGKNSNLKV